jgi:hypothetical protein
MADKPEALRCAEWLDSEIRRTVNADIENLYAAAELRRLHAANLKLAGAIDMIRETLNGGTVDDLLYIINTALAEHRGNHD